MTDRIYGINAIEQALLAGTGQRLLLPEGRLNGRQRELQALCERQGCPVEYREKSTLPAQGALLEAETPSMRDEKALQDLLAGPDAETQPLFLLLDGVTDPRNFGACLRSAASFSVDGVIVPRDNAAPLNDAAIKTASGGASLVPVYQVANLGRTMDRLQKAGIWIVGTVLEATQELAEIDLKGPIALVMGSEDAGLRQKTREKCDFLARIPVPMPDLSLNVSVATGICLYEARKQR